MLNIDTGFKTINASSEIIFNYLSNIDNLKDLMPEQVVNWTSDADSCRYTIKGMAEIGMRMAERNPNSLLHIKSDGKVPFQFDLKIIIEAISSESAQVKLDFAGDMNMMLKMMAEKPLSNFFHYQLNALEKKFS
jgi:hypothetical protein